MARARPEVLRPVPREVVEEKIGVFIDTFVARPRRERARQFLLSTPARRAEGLLEVQHWLDPSLCRWHTGKAGFEQSLWSTNAELEAVCLHRAAEYATLQEMEARRPALVLVRRELAFVLPDDMGVIACIGR